MTGVVQRIACAKAHDLRAQAPVTRAKARHMGAKARDPRAQAQVARAEARDLGVKAHDLRAQAQVARAKARNFTKMVHQKSLAAIEKPFTGRISPKIFFGISFIRVLTRPREPWESNAKLISSPARGETRNDRLFRP
jgi:hypothetical protein